MVQTRLPGYRLDGDCISPIKHLRLEETSGDWRKDQAVLQKIVDKVRLVLFVDTQKPVHPDDPVKNNFRIWDKNMNADQGDERLLLIHWHFNACKLHF